MLCRLCPPLVLSWVNLGKFCILGRPNHVKIVALRLWSHVRTVKKADLIKFRGSSDNVNTSTNYIFLTTNGKYGMKSCTYQCDHTLLTWFTPSSLFNTGIPSWPVLPNHLCFHIWISLFHDLDLWCQCKSRWSFFSFRVIWVNVLWHYFSRCR